MAEIIVLGAGMVGSAMAIDLSENHKVTLADLNLNSLEKIKSKTGLINTIQLDVTRSESLKEAVQPFDLVVCAVPGFLGFNVLKSLIEAGKNVVDISFFSENALELSQLAVQNEVTVIVDCGVAPGLGNIILGHHNERMKITDFECLVGGLPKIKKWPFYYKAPFSPVDVIEEYTRPARYVENGHTVIKEALSDCELIEFEKIGTLEAFNTDGLRSLIFTMPHIKNMKEKTLRYPGHVDTVKALKAVGFFDKKPIDIKGQSISPIEFTSKILFHEWKLEEGEDEFTIMKIKLKGLDSDGNQQTVVYELYDEYDPKTQTSSMARTTGYTATAAANWFLEGNFNEKGIWPPELIGKQNGCYEFVMAYLQERGVRFNKTPD
ncbi:MAG: saccharopine dehydrogenase C-terminal domain-containing protein [Weeksellaceae bacterium]